MIATLYFQPWTAADGSTRRAFFERVPEAAPSHEGHVATLSDIKVLESDAFSSKCMAALCRCAVEDWLMSLWPNVTEFYVSTLRGREGVQTHVQIELMLSGGYTRSFAGMTLDHAMLAAAHAVADSRGVPH